jgi:hypothetical protein
MYRHKISGVFSNISRCRRLLYIGGTMAMITIRHLLTLLEAHPGDSRGGRFIIATIYMVWSLFSIRSASAPALVPAMSSISSAAPGEMVSAEKNWAIFSPCPLNCSTPCWPRTAIWDYSKQAFEVMRQYIGHSHLVVCRHLHIHRAKRGTKVVHRDKTMILIYIE